MTSETGYSSPIVIDAGGTRQLIFWHATALVSLNPETGETYWEQEFRNTGGLSIGTPVRSGRYLLISQFRTGSMMMTLDNDRPAARMLWKGQSRSELPHLTDGLHAMMSTPDHHRRLSVRRRQLRRAAWHRRHDRGATLAERCPDRAGPIRDGVFRAPRRPVFRDHRLRRAGHCAFHTGRLRGARSDPAARADPAHAGRRVGTVE